MIVSAIKAPGERWRIRGGVSGFEWDKTGRPAGEKLLTLPIAQSIINSPLGLKPSASTFGILPGTRCHLTIAVLPRLIVLREMGFLP